MSICPMFKKFMEDAFTAKEVVGYGKVLQANVGYGAMPDIKLYVEGDAGATFWLSAKDLYELGNVEFI